MSLLATERDLSVDEALGCKRDFRLKQFLIERRHIGGKQMPVCFNAPQPQISRRKTSTNTPRVHSWEFLVEWTRNWTVVGLFILKSNVYIISVIFVIQARATWYRVFIKEKIEGFTYASVLESSSETH